MLNILIQRAAKDKPLWLPELRELFNNLPGSRPVMVRLTSHQGQVRDYRLSLPLWEGEEQHSLVRSFFLASIYNLLAACSARELRLFYDTADASLAPLVPTIEQAFQLRETKRRGLGKVINIAERISRACGTEGFTLAASDLKDYSRAGKQKDISHCDLAARLLRQAEAAGQRNLVGVDVGGTDIKLAAAKNGQLAAVKEYDWHPGASRTAEGIVEPILLLVRLMRCCLAEDLPEELGAKLAAALRREASDAEMRAAVEACETLLGEKINLLDGVGVSFPDVVLDDAIVGGETPKTEGLRANPAFDYETEFAKLRDLRLRLLPLCREGGRVHLANDGSIAAYTAAMELAHGEDPEIVQPGVLAHSLGTDLGTGWLQSDGSIPPLPLELYDLILDLGSFRSRAWAPQDLRSTRNENSGLPGARRYMGQAAAYRLAWELRPALLEGYTVERDGCLEIALEPEDLRKAALEHLMQLADQGQSEAQEVFRRIGEHLAVLTRELRELLHPQPRRRYVFGRFVKSPACFALLQEGFSRADTGARLCAPDESLALSPLMRQLAAREDVTVAQFGQAVGAIYYAMNE